MSDAKRDRDAFDPETWRTNSRAAGAAEMLGDRAASEGDEHLRTAIRGVTPGWLDDPEEAHAEQRSQCRAKVAPRWTRKRVWSGSARKSARSQRTL
jgi:hypothetical protein